MLPLLQYLVNESRGAQVFVRRIHADFGTDGSRIKLGVSERWAAQLAPMTLVTPSEPKNRRHEHR
jgi:hypothetical protein